MDENLVKEYQSIKDRVSELEANKIKTKTELELTEKELTDVTEQLKAYGIEDLSKLDEIVSNKKEEFQTQLSKLKEQLDNVSRA